MWYFKLEFLQTCCYLYHATDTVENWNHQELRAKMGFPLRLNSGSTEEHLRMTASIDLKEDIRVKHLSRYLR